MRALIKEQWFARGATVRINAIAFQLVGKRLFHIQQHPVKARMLGAQAIQNSVHISRLSNRAVKIRGQPIDAVL